MRPAAFLLAALSAAGSALAYAGDMTYYTPGLGACGKYNKESDRIVALSPAQYGRDANPNKAKVCGRKISIHYQGKTATATVVDKCPGCASGSIDVSPAVFRQLAPLDKGRVRVTWGYASSAAVKVEELGAGQVRLLLEDDEGEDDGDVVLPPVSRPADEYDSDDYDDGDEL
ncbi:RlpA-like double-psi beta-barrel-protein domain-containing protein-containing protein [Durotheca rogersii]|uniref:RlpA-like double-psi beta-barrel-protein domain-containing protein-containing protein n=1 Tax=Durotheca rogersii TaxID=419775 RepID=UPI002220C08C|nr:RlpA-like double-psi beta-barrel-protein domain-containing protein-containing protein [Durotheca rogersii]KAI5867568.1 RlpA-like double-psi beta-barrel-protein domain-containing protein-containing protein [Durotheca rogersii]